MSALPIPDPENYGWHPPNTGADSWHVPEDLIPHYREFRPGYWGYVCPSCRCVFPPGLGEKIIRDFRAHIKPYPAKECWFRSKG